MRLVRCGLEREPSQGVDRHEPGIDRDEQVAEPCGQGVYRSHRAAVEANPADHAGVARDCDVHTVLCGYLHEGRRRSPTVRRFRSCAEARDGSALRC